MVSKAEVPSTGNIQSEVLQMSLAFGILLDRFEALEEVVLAHVVALFRVAVHEAVIPGVWKALVIVAPGDTLVLKKVHNSRHVFVDVDVAVAVEAKSVAAGGSDVVGLTRGSDAIHLSQENTLLNEGLAVG